MNLVARERLWRTVVALGVLQLNGCVTHYDSPGASGAGGGEVAGSVDNPQDAKMYTTARGSDGVRGGKAARDAQALLQEELTERGDIAEPDATLAATAAWVLQRAYARRESPASAIASSAQHWGFAGLMVGSVTGSTSAEQTRTTLHEIVTQVPQNMPINRYGIAAGRGDDAVIVLGDVEAELEDFPRSVAPGGSFRLKGDVSERFERASVFATNPDGKVEEFPMKGRAIDATLAFPDTGVYKLEVLGYGKTGPVVLVNVPVNVGVAASGPVDAGEIDPSLTTEKAEAELLALLNDERAKHGLDKVAADAELRTVALAHSNDMSDHHFFGHVSPTTGGPEDRVRAAHLRVSKVGECVALDFTPAAAHRGLMDSPAHRAAMLDPTFTHVGIGVAFVEGKGGRRLDATLLFGRRPPPGDARMTAGDVIEAISAQRKARKLPPLQGDPVLTAAANAGSRALANGSAKEPAQVLAAIGREMQRQVNLTRRNQSAYQFYGTIIDREQLDAIPLLQRADIVRLGVGTAPLEDETGPTLAVVLLAGSGPGKPTQCSQ